MELNRVHAHEQSGRDLLVGVSRDGKLGDPLLGGGERPVLPVRAESFELDLSPLQPKWRAEFFEEGVRVFERLACCLTLSSPSQYVAVHEPRSGELEWHWQP